MLQIPLRVRAGLSHIRVNVKVRVKVGLRAMVTRWSWIRVGLGMSSCGYMKPSGTRTAVRKIKSRSPLPLSTSATSSAIKKVSRT